MHVIVPLFISVAKEGLDVPLEVIFTFFAFIAPPFVAYNPPAELEANDDIFEPVIVILPLFVAKTAFAPLTAVEIVLPEMFAFPPLTSRAEFIP